MPYDDAADMDFILIGHPSQSHLDGTMNDRQSLKVAVWIALWNRVDLSAVRRWSGLPIDLRSSSRR